MYVVATLSLCREVLGKYCRVKYTIIISLNTLAGLMDFAVTMGIILSMYLMKDSTNNALDSNTFFNVAGGRVRYDREIHHNSAHV
jgi:hypothetical protein